MKYFVALLVTGVMLSACGHKKVKLDDSFKAGKNGLVTVTSGWVKDKKSKFDIQVKFVNESAQALLIHSDEVHCYRGNTEGTISNIGDSGIYLNSQETKSFNTHCDFSSTRPRGDFKVHVDKVYSGTGDKKKVAENLELIVPESAVNN